MIMSLVRNNANANTWRRLWAPLDSAYSLSSDAFQWIYSNLHTHKHTHTHSALPPAPSLLCPCQFPMPSSAVSSYNWHFKCFLAMALVQWVHRLLTSPPLAWLRLNLINCFNCCTQSVRVCVCVESWQGDALYVFVKPFDTSRSWLWQLIEIIIRCT